VFGKTKLNGRCMISGIILIAIGLVHLIKPDIFFKSGFFLSPENFKKVQRGVALLVLLMGVYFIIYFK
jgi:hypothetical protein